MLALLIDDGELVILIMQNTFIQSIGTLVSTRNLERASRWSKLLFAPPAAYHQPTAQRDDDIWASYKIYTRHVDDFTHVKWVDLDLLQGRKVAGGYLALCPSCTDSS
ncbi:hypothetical protein NM208_g10567 [Fusarium decemcellulare]|uniref:Uncharacterized protein n=1 Tax=Fusarium decemcellulare TaxID=57161 RepID=A0ACC1RXF9_9HYPO|nr:hypothetical protein NM208_g10567 [Fusarium decemcellulare]